MRFVVEQSELSKTLGRLQGVMSHKQASPLAVRALADGTLEFQASDNLAVVRARMQAQVESPGETSVRGRFFYDLAREMPNGPLSFAQSNGQVVLESRSEGECVVSLPEMRDYAAPPQEDRQWGDPIVLDAARFCYMVEQVHYCVAADNNDNRYVGVAYLHRVVENPEDRLRLVGSDGYRLSMCDMVAEKLTSFPARGVCLTRKALTELERLAKDATHLQLRLSDDERVLQASVPGCDMEILLASVQYPDYLSVLPESAKAPIRLSRERLSEAARRILLVTAKSKVMQFDFNHKTLTISTRDQQSPGQGHEAIPLASGTSEELKISLNGSYLWDLTNAAISQDLDVHVKSRSTPVLFVPVQEPSACRSKHVLVPIAGTE